MRSLAVGIAAYWGLALAALEIYLPGSRGDPGFLSAPFSFVLLGAMVAPGDFVGPTSPSRWLLLLPLGGVVFLVVSALARRGGWAAATVGLSAIGAAGAIVLLTGYS
ncbi:MAG: hypothetical protein QNJ13_04685 [Paracoccaceae bacterium]|nr:hypothetical protein [Paracoccaceae bacterium]